MNVLLGVTGSVATTLISKLISKLQAAGHEVQVVATNSALYFFQPDEQTVRVWQDRDEWPEGLYQKGQSIPHIALRDWADIFVIAPFSANTLAKMANGLCDNLLTSVVRAWPPDKQLILAPAMNTFMWQHPASAQHLAQLAEWYDLRIISPIAKTLACGDDGVGAMARIEDIVRAVY